MSVVLLRADARHLPIPDASVDLIVTSPPFWQLRSYTDGGEHYKGQIGSEDTPQEYIAALLDCTREWMRVLKPTGSMFVELGDKYATRYSSVRGRGRKGLNGDDDTRARSGQNHTSAGEKSLLGLPWRYALACMDELGLILRRDNVWDKVNPLPESPTDRCATTHEYLFHLVKQSRYYAAIDELREPQQSSGEHHNGRSGYVDAPGYIARSFTTRSLSPLGKLPGSVWRMPIQPLKVPVDLDVDHFAAFPFELPRRCITGWSPPGICTACGEGRKPIVVGGRRGDGAKPHKTALRVASFDWAAWKEGTPHRIIGQYCACTPYTDHPASDKTTTRRARAPEATRPQGTYGRKQAGEYERVGPWREYHLDAWVAAPTRPAVVADPFGGTGSTALVADVLGRTGLSFDLSADYCRLARWRTSDPSERAKALQVPKPPPVIDGQESLFEVGA